MLKGTRRVKTVLAAGVALGALLLAALTPAGSAKPAVAAPRGVPGNWKLILNSTFTGSSLDQSMWRPGWFGSSQATSPINAHEPVCYSPRNVSFPGDGTVHLSVVEQSIRCNGSQQPFSAAIISSNPSDGRKSGGFQYRYGVLEARVYFPGQHGRIFNWAAVLTLGQRWPADGEDDVFESIHGYPCHSIHSAAYPDAGLLGCDHKIGPGWHTVAVDWEPHVMTWYYDGAAVGVERTGVTSSPMYIAIVNTVSTKAVDLIHPASLQVQYVRVWRKAK